MNESTPMTLRRRLFKLIPYVVGIATIIAMLLYLQNSNLLSSFDFRQMRWEFVAGIALTEIGAYALRGIVLALFVAEAGIVLTPFEWMGLSVATQVTNLMMPFSGAFVARAGYLKARHNLPTSRFLALLTASHLIILLVSGVSGLIILAWMQITRGGDFPVIAVLILAAMAAAPALLMALPLERLPLPSAGRLMRWIQAAMDGWREIRTNMPLLWKQIAVITVLQVVQAASFYLALYALAMPVTFAQTLLLGVMLNLTNFVRITPGALGVREGIAALSAELVGFDAAQGFSAALLVRLVQWAIAFLIGPIFMVMLARRAQESFSATD
jgi:uncharacterized membrane protein YbhN (UPF0104 family)